MQNTNEVTFIEKYNPSDINAQDLQFAQSLAQIRISDIQGTELRSPLEGQLVTQVPGIVTALASNGFYLQDPNPDSDDATSEGIFIFTGTRTLAVPVKVGDSVQVSGLITEFQAGGATSNNLTTTQINANRDTNEITVLSSNNAIPTATIIGEAGRNPATESISPDGILFYESLEGMRVIVKDSSAVSPTGNFSNNSSIWVVADQGANATGINDRGGITISPTDFNPERIQITDDLLRIKFRDSRNNPAFTLPQVNVGFSLGDVTGVVGYSFGNYQVLATETFTARSARLQPEVTDIVGTSDKLTIASYNVENLNPFSGLRFEGFADQIIKNLKSPDIIALQEIQDNNGPIDDGTVAADQTYQSLIDAIADAGGPTYQLVNIDPQNNEDGGQPGSNIRVGYLYNPSRVSLVEGSVRRIIDPNLVDGDAFAPIPIPTETEDPIDAFRASRNPLVATFKFNGQEITTINNHLTSRSGSSPLFGDLQPIRIRGLEERNAQATIIKSEVDEILATNPNANVVVLGDLNGFEFEQHLDILKGGTTPELINLNETLPATERYTFNFQGNSQSLDHFLVTNNLATQAQYDIVHVNVEFADQLADHEPLVASLNLPPQTPDPTNFTLQILHASDQEAGVPAFQDIPGFSAVMNALDGKYANSLKLTTGDVYIASPFFNASRDLYNNAITGNAADQPGIADILIQNKLGWDVASVGNHEFTGGASTFFSLLAPNANLINGTNGAGIGEGGYQGTLFPYLANNLDYSNASLPSGLTVVANGGSPQPNTLTGSVISDVNGEKIGLIGIVTPYLRSIANTERVTVTTLDPNGNEITGTSTVAVQVDSIIANITPEVQALKDKGINKIILMTHLQESRIEQALAQKMADLGLGVDILFGGGSHQLQSSGNLPLRGDETQQNTGQLLQPFPQEFINGNNKVLFVNSAPNYRYLNQLVVTFDQNGVINNVGGDSGAYATDIAGVDRLYAESITTLEGVKAKADQEIVEIVEGARTFVNAIDGNIFGQADVFLNGIRGDVRVQETNLGNLAADAQDFYAEAYLKQHNDLLPGFNKIDISFLNGGSIRDFIGQSLVETSGGNELRKLPTAANPEVGKEEGDISQLDLANSFRFDGDLVVGTVDAAGFLQIAEHMISSVETGNGRFGQIGGFKFSFDPDMIAGNRIQSLALVDPTTNTSEAIVRNSELVVPTDRIFTVTTSRFSATGGDNYPLVIQNIRGLTDFAEPDSLGKANLASGRLQDAVAEYFAATYNSDKGQVPFAQADTSQAEDTRIQNLNFRSDTILPEVTPPPEEIVSGTNGDDVLWAGRDFRGINSTVFAGAGNDEIDVPVGGEATGFNRIDAGSGNDTVFVSNGDRANGGSGDDFFDASGASGYRLSGGKGNDIFDLGMSGRAIGGDGDDKFYVLEGGDNLLAGGAGADQFWLLTDDAALIEIPNTVTDFTQGVDVIGIMGQGAGINFASLTRTGNSIALNGDTFATLTGVNTTTLTAADFVFM